MIRKAASSDIESIAHLHHRYIPGYLHNMGVTFLSRFYQNFMKLPGAVLLVDGVGEETAGFIAGYTPADSLFQDLVRESKFSLAFSVLARAVTHPGEIVDFRELIDYGKRTALPEVDGELLFIAVLPEMRKSGTADRLVEKACEFLAEKGAKKIKVSADKENRGPNELLLRLGFELKGEFPLRGRGQNLYIRSSVKL